jgi:hypothetical protein
MSKANTVGMEQVLAFLILMGYGTLVMILWPLERLTRRRRGE